MIGIFDSGSGGLTVLRALKAVLPNAEITYFGDTKYAPYGNRSREELGALTVLGIKRLIDGGCTHIITACNSVSVTIVEPLLQIAGMQRSDMIEMVGPTVRALAERDAMRILLVATKATIEAGLYQTKLGALGHEVIPVAIPELAGAIEQGASEREVTEIITEALDPLHVPPKAMLFGCTHYPLALSSFEMVSKLKGWDVECIDPAFFVSKEATVRFTGEEGSGKIYFKLSKESPEFRERVQSLFADFPYTIEVV